MSIKTGELKKGYDCLARVKTSMELVRSAKKECRELADHVLVLAPHDKLWPRTFTSSIFLELQVELGLMDTSAALCEKQHGLAERALQEATSIFNEDVVFQQMQQTPPQRGNMTIDQAFDAEIANVEVFTEDVRVLFNIFIDHVKTIRGILGL